MWYLLSMYWMIAGNAAISSHTITPNLTETQCKRMAENIIEQFESTGLKRNNTGNMIKPNTDYVVECKRMGE